MFSPEMMQAAQKMMANMKPEDMQRMSQMAANMDPKVMENMMKNMGPQAAGMDAAKAVEQMKKMSPEEIQAGMSQAQTQFKGQRQYYYNAAEMLKNEGNGFVKSEKYSDALGKYTKALENLTGQTGDEISALQVVLLSNQALCHLGAEDYPAALEASEDAMKIDPKSFKALFRHGQAKAELGCLGEAVADVRRAAELSPGDKAIAAELARLREQLKEQGLTEDTAPKTHAVRAEWQQPPADVTATPSTSSGSRASSSSSRPGAVPPEQERWAKAAEQLAENPDMLKQATEVMSRLSNEELQSMMSNAPLPPGVDAATMRSQMEQIKKNPDMIKSAMESLQALPEEERKKMLGQRSAMASAAFGGGGAGGPADINKVFENPELLQQAVNMTKDMSEDDLKKLNINSKEEADMMRKAAEQMAADPNLTKQMSDMMKNMNPDQLKEMMELSSSMRGAAGGAGGGMGGMPDMSKMDPSAMLSDPDMMKATEQMMKSMSPETLASMARASGVDMSEDKARMLAKFLPLMMRLMRWFGYLKKGWSYLTSKNGRVALAVVVLGIAVYQHYRSS